jgi:hypothetical protein
MDESSALGRENAELLSPCHTQISLPVAAFCGKARASDQTEGEPFGCGQAINVLDLFS